MFKRNVVTTIFAMLISLSSMIPGFAGAVTRPHQRVHPRGCELRGVYNQFELWTN
jgi:hypothetical protein